MPIPVSVTEIERILQKHKDANNNKLTSSIALCKLKFLKKKGDNIFPEAINYLKTYPNTFFGEIKVAIIMARDAIPFDKPDQINDYYNTLTMLAVKQNNDKNSLETIGFILNEKKKLEAIIPELRK